MAKKLTAILLALALVILSVTGCAPREPVTLRVLSYNIRHGDGMDRHIDLERVAKVIREANPDLVAVQEVDRGVKRSSGVDQPAELARLTGMHAFFEKNIEFQGGDYGNAVLSRLPVEYHKNHPLPQSQPREQRGALEVRVRVSGRPITFIATHLDYHPTDAERLASIAMFKGMVERCGKMPVIIAGDFNASPDSEVLKRAVGFLRDTFDPAGPDRFTFPADAPHDRIDYILYTQYPTLKCVEYRIIPEPLASDHRPILAVFTVSP